MDDIKNNLKLIELERNLESLKRNIDRISSTMNGLLLDNQNFIKRKDPINPGIGCKFAYDANGMILHELPLSASDVPMIQIDQVDGLKNYLNTIVGEADLKKLQNEMKELVIKRSNTVAGTAAKVNYDANGLVISGSSLTIDDIPTLPLSKIEGLVDLIDIIKSMSNSTPVNHEDQINVKSGTYAKVSVDTHGRVISGSGLSTNDLPIDFITRFNQLESIIPGLASQTTMDTLISSLNKKVDGTANVTPGVYTKLTVGRNGLVTNGEALSKKDLPALSIDDIEGLDSALRERAMYLDVLDLNDTVSNIIGTVNKSSMMCIELSEKIEDKASNNDVATLRQDLNSVIMMVNKLSQPDTNIMKEIDEIKRELSNISGRVTVLEHKQ